MKATPTGVLKNLYFARGDAFTLGFNRFLVCGWIFYVYFFYRGHYASFWAEVPDVYWMPIHAYRWLPLPKLSATGLVAMDVVWCIALIATAVGFMTRYSSWIALLVGSYVVSFPQNFGKVDTSDGPVLLMLFILAASRCGDAFSVDAWMSGKRQNDGVHNAAYGWPIRAGQVLFVCIFFAAGVSKLKNSGIAWMTAENMSSILLQVHYTGLPAGRMGLWLADQPFICWVMAVSTVLCETLVPLALFSRRLSALIVPALFAMIVGFKLCLGHWPVYLLVLFAFWIPWHRLPIVRTSSKAT